MRTSFVCMKNIIATFRARPGCGVELEKILREQVRLTAAEPGAMVYDLLRDDANPDTLVVIERYRDAAAKASHLGTSYLAETIRQAVPLLVGEPELQHLATVSCIRHEQREVDGRSVELVTMPIGPVSLVYARTENGLLACGAIDPAALEKFGIPAARVKPTGGSSIGCFDDLLSGEVREANAAAAARGVKPGQSGREALALL